MPYGKSGKKTGKYPWESKGQKTHKRKSSPGRKKTSGSGQGSGTIG